MPITQFLWGDSGSGLSERAWRHAETEGAAWVGNSAAAHMSLMRSTVRDELAVAMEQRGVGTQEMSRAVDKALAFWGLQSQADQDPTQLSTGQTRRVAIATALLANPRALVLDCPCDGLDTEAVELLRHSLEAFDGPVTVYDRMHNLLVDSAAEVAHLDGRPVPPPRLHEVVSPPDAQSNSTQPDFIAKDVTVERANTVGPLNVTANAGRITHLAGPNGSGKTTLFLASLGLLKYSGQIVGESFGWCPTDMDSAITRKTVREELALGAGAQLAQQMLEFAGLMDVADVHPLDVPSARRRILLTAAAMVRAPHVVFLDEPTVGLDTPRAGELASLMRRYVAGEYHQKLGLDAPKPTVVWTCNDPKFAAVLSDEMMQL